jgi:hypothetical protein
MYGNKIEKRRKLFGEIEKGYVYLKNKKEYEM